MTEPEVQPESPCECQKRQTRVVFPNIHAARTWAMIGGAIVTWVVWVSVAVTRVSVVPSKCVSQPVVLGGPHENYQTTSTPTAHY